MEQRAPSLKRLQENKRQRQWRHPKPVVWSGRLCNHPKLDQLCTCTVHSARWAVRTKPRSLVGAHASASSRPAHCAPQSASALVSLVPLGCACGRLRNVRSCQNSARSLLSCAGSLLPLPVPTTIYSTLIRPVPWRPRTPSATPPPHRAPSPALHVLCAGPVRSFRNGSRLPE